MGWSLDGMNQLFAAAGVKPYWGAHFSDTMDSHRLARYATTVGRGESMWDALSRKYFEGKTDIAPIRLDSRALLMEAAGEAGLDAAAAAGVVDDPAAFRSEVRSVVDAMQDRGVRSIPVLIFHYGGAHAVHHGSGNKAAFAEILRDVYARARPAAAM